jgi:hypothetical protein
VGLLVELEGFDAADDILQLNMSKLQRAVASNQVGLYSDQHIKLQDYPELHI